jgi:ABC-2 type transport system permease protein
MQIIWDREFGFLKETLVAPVPRVAIMLGRTFGEATAATLQGCIVLLLALFFVFTRIVAC